MRAKSAGTTGLTIFMLQMFPHNLFTQSGNVTKKIEIMTTYIAIKYNFFVVLKA